MDGRYTEINSNKLHNYGIQNEESDLRAHVCVHIRRVYVFPTEEGRREIETGRWPKVSNGQDGVKGITAKGYLVPPSAIKGCTEVVTKKEDWEHADFKPDDNTSVKGDKAVRLVENTIRAGIFPFLDKVLAIDSDVNFAIQIKGTDIIVHRRTYIQVKCDYNGGDSSLGGTGNLYLQVAERNPLKRYGALPKSIDEDEEALPRSLRQHRSGG